MIEHLLANHLHHPARHAFGYNADETERVAKSEAANLRRIAFGFNADEIARIDQAATYDSPLRQSFYPLLEWGWTRQHCIDYLYQKLGIIWRRSACVQCPFNALKGDAIARQMEHPDQIADAMMLEHVSLSLNPRGTLYRNRSLIEITDANANYIAADNYRTKLDRSPWAVYRVRRLYYAREDKNGKAQPNKKGIAYRAVERITDDLARLAAVDHLHGLAMSANQIAVRRGITYLYREHCAGTSPTREEFLVVAPAVVETKARYGLDWFDNKWDERQGSLFE